MMALMLSSGQVARRRLMALSHSSLIPEAARVMLMSDGVGVGASNSVGTSSAVGVGVPNST
eukprot:13834963-Alexandrium_andersonii.AAC.1